MVSSFLLCNKVISNYGVGIYIRDYLDNIKCRELIKIDDYKIYRSKMLPELEGIKVYLDDTLSFLEDDSIL